MKTPKAINDLMTFLAPMRSDAQAQRAALSRLRDEERSLLTALPSEAEIVEMVTNDISEWRRRILHDASLRAQVLAAVSPSIMVDGKTGEITAAPRLADVSMPIGQMAPLATLVALVPGAVVAGILSLLREQPIPYGSAMPDRLARLAELRREIGELEARQRDLAQEAEEIASRARQAVR